MTPFIIISEQSISDSNAGVFIELWNQSRKEYFELSDITEDSDEWKSVKDKTLKKTLEQIKQSDLEGIYNPWYHCPSNVLNEVS